MTSALTAGKGIDEANLRGIYKYSTAVLETAVSPKKIAMYTAKKTKVIKTVVSAVKDSIQDGINDGVERGIKRRFSLA